MIASCIVTCNCHWNYTNNVCDIVVFDGSRSAPTFTSVNYHYKLTAVKANSSPCMQHDFTIFKNILVQALGMFSTVVFFVPVTSSTNTREKIINRSRTEMSQPAVPAATDSETTSATLTTVQQPISDHPSDTGADSDPPAYSSIIGEGDTSQNAHSGGVEEPYYAQAQPGIDPPAATIGEADSPHNANDCPTVPMATGGGVEDGSHYSQALCMERRITLTAVADDQTRHDEPPSYESIIA